jgi:glyoxylase-like metal-dependent hydrolase (beta-lactamase superfamily II)
LKVERLPVGIYLANCYLVYCDDTKDALVIDPGGDSDEILDRIEKLGLKIKYIILTHGHGDHIGGLLDVKNKTGAPVLIHEKDEEYLKDNQKNLSNMMSLDNVELKADRLLKDGDKLTLGKSTVEIIYTPGHTPGGISIKIDNCIFTGDTLFAGSVGRTDFAGGSYEEIIHSVNERLIIYPDDTIIYPGHGPSSTIGKEKDSNPFVKR